MHQFLAQGYVSPEDSLYAAIEQVPPGTVLTVGEEGRTRWRFWQPTRKSDIVRLEEAVEAFEPIWQKVVEDHLVSDVCIGVLQSGCVDSSLVSLSIARHRMVPLFTAPFEEASYDEANIAASFANELELALHCIPIESGHKAIATFKAVAHHVDGQVADASAYPHFLLSRAVREHVTVALSGDGADDFFGGYPTYRATRIAEAVRGYTPKSAWRMVGRTAALLASGSEGKTPHKRVSRTLRTGNCVSAVCTACALATACSARTRGPSLWASVTPLPQNKCDGEL